MPSDDVAAVIELASVAPEPLLDEMTEYGRERNFPIVGPNAGRLLRLLARTADAERVFEFGSGYGYSAAWFAGALPPDGEVVLTDYDEDNLATARRFFREGGYDDLARYEVGDAIETFADETGEFDVVLIDNEKTKYVEALEAARGQVADGGLVVADNVFDGPHSPDEVRAALDGADAGNEHARGIARYLQHVRSDPDLETAFVPLGEGLAVTRVGR